VKEITTEKADGVNVHGQPLRWLRSRGVFYMKPVHRVGKHLIYLPL